MKKPYWIIVLVFIVLAVAGILRWNIQGPAQNNQIAQECSNQDGYCVYNNIPAYLKYTSPDEEFPGSTGQDIVNQYFKRIASDGQEQYDVFSFPEKWACKNGDKILEIEYFYYSCVDEKMDGCGLDRKAFVCDDVYFIYQSSNSTGPVGYGPLPIEN